MRKHRLAAAAALSIAGGALLPMTAHADASPALFKHAMDVRGASGPADSADAAGFKAFTAKPADASPLSVQFTVTQNSALGFDLKSVVTDATPGATIASDAVSTGSSTVQLSASASDATTYTGTWTSADPGTFTLTDTVTDNQGASTAVTATVTTAGSAMTPIGPTRLLDTRSGTGAAKAKVAKGGIVKLKVGGVDGIPATGVTAVVLNVTATDTTGNGFVTVYPSNDGSTPPDVSNVNYTAGQTVANLTTVQVGSDGYVYLANGGAQAGSIDVIADVTGYFTATKASLYNSEPAPQRLLDTRSGAGAPKAQVAKGGVVKLKVGGVDGVPAAGAVSAVAVNITATDTHGAGFVTAYPDGATVPNASNLNYTAAKTVANLAIVPVGADGSIDLANGGSSAAGIDLIADIEGYYSASAASGAYVPLAPTRVFDGRSAGNGPIPNGDADVIDFGAWTQNVAALSLNATVTDTQGSGFLTAYPYGQPLPNASNLNWTRGETVPNMVIGQLGDERMEFYNGGANGGDADLILDAFGYYQTAAQS